MDIGWGLSELVDIKGGSRNELRVVRLVDIKAGKRNSYILTGVRRY